jgi:hypothetical protein
MKRFFSVLALLVTTAIAAPDTDDEVAARRAALDLAGAWTNDGFKLRDGHFSGALKQGESKLIRVNLYAGNQYWFTAAATPKAKKLELQIFDESGKSVTFEPYQDEGRAAAGFAPTASGPYFIKVVEVEGEPSSFVLVYSYR